MSILLKDVKLILKQLKSTDKEKVLQALRDLKVRLCKNGVETILKVDGAFDAIFNLIDKNGGEICSLVLSILSICATRSEQWRNKIYEVNAISMLRDLLETNTNVWLIRRIICLLCIVSKNSNCLGKIQSSYLIIGLIIMHGGSSDIKCQMSCLRAIRVVCTSKQSAKKAVDNSGFSVLLSHLHSTDRKVIKLVLIMMYQLLETNVREVFEYIGKRVDMLRLINLCLDSSFKDLGVKVLKMFSLNSYAVMEGTITFLVWQIKSPSESDAFKLAVQSVCLCARENISRELMIELGALSELTNILNDNDYKNFHEIIVAAILSFQYSNHSIMVPALIKCLDSLTFIEYSQFKKNISSSIPSSYSPTSPKYSLASASSSEFSMSSTGSIHYIMCLLSTISKYADSSMLFLDLPCFNSLLNYMVMALHPDPRCDDMLSCLISNSDCFNMMVRLRLIPRLFLRLDTGHSLESLTALFGKAREKRYSNPDSIYYDENDLDSILYFYCTPMKTTWRMCLSSNLRSERQSLHSEKYFPDILLSGSMELKEQCVVSMAYTIFHMRELKRIYIELKALDFLVYMMHRCEELSNETFVLLVESFCELARKLDLKTSFKASKDMSQNTIQKEYPMERPSKYRKLDGQQVVKLCVCSGTVFECNKDKLAEGSQVFCRMLSDNYLDCQQPCINIRNVDEEAFEVLLHYINGCEVHIDEYKQCQSSYCDIKRIKGNNVVEEPNKSFSSTFAANVFICSEMFFLDNLKKNSEEFLNTCINNDNVVELLFLAFQYHAETLLKDSLVYLLANCDCPIYRSQCFAELFYSSEKLTFIKHVKNIMLETL